MRPTRAAATAIPLLFLALASSATAHEVQVLRGAQPSLAEAVRQASDVVVLRGARVGGAIPPLEAPAAPAAPVAAPAPVASVVQIFVGPVLSPPAPLSVLPRWRLPQARRPALAPRAPAVWRHPLRVGGRDR